MMVAESKGGASMMDSMGRNVIRSNDPAAAIRRAGDLLSGKRPSTCEMQARKRLFARIEEKTHGDRR
jgi:hypothetical protein